jgi:hypothetical protein
MTQETRRELGEVPHGATRRGAMLIVATKLTTSMGGRDDNDLIVMETISALRNTNSSVVYWSSRGWMEAEGGWSSTQSWRIVFMTLSKATNVPCRSWLL